MNDQMHSWGAKRSVIREIFEYGKQRKAEIGEQNVFDFSLGNPSVPSPETLQRVLLSLLQGTEATALHGYTSAQGSEEARKSIANYLNTTYDAGVEPGLIYMTCGAAASLTLSLTAILNPGDEVVVLAPFFPEYRVFVERIGAKLISVLCDFDTFQPDFVALEKVFSPNTRAIIVNSPNNPTGAVLSEESILCLSELLRRKSQEFGNPIYLISDEPYRELVYGDEKLPYLTKYYDRTLVCYSFSKSLSLPGERIGFLLVSPKMPEAKELFEAVCGAGRALGFVCAPSLFQRLIAECIGMTSDLSVYRLNRNLLWGALQKMGYTGVNPQGAFYIFLKSPEESAAAFCERAKEKELLLVPSDDFGCPGYVRISYCVSTEQIRRSLPAFEALAKEYGLKQVSEER